MGQARDEQGNIWETDDAGNAVRLISAGQQQGYQTKAPDPGYAYEGQKAALEVQAMQARMEDMARDNARQDRETNKPPAGYQWGSNGHLVAIPGGPADKSSSGIQLTAKERADAIGGYKSAEALSTIIAELEQKYKAGPGSTSGIMGLTDYLPTAKNQQFDRASNAARGTVGQALGFTGGQLNSVAEAQMNIGPYIAQSDDKDATILDSIQRLKDLQQQAKERSIAILGGVPDSNGRITPLDEMQPQVGELDRTPPRYDTNAVGLNVGSEELTGADDYELVDDPTLRGVNAQYRKLLSEVGTPNGLSPNELAEWAKSAGIYDEGRLNSIREQGEFRLKYPDVTLDKYSTSNVGKINRPLSSGEQLINNFGRSPVGAAAITFSNSAALGIPGALVGERGRLGMEQVREDSPISSFFGDIGGIMTGTSALGKLGSKAIGSVAPKIGERIFADGAGKAAARGIGTDAAYGAIYGGVTDGDPVTGALMAGGGSAAGRGLASSVGRAVTGVTNPAVQRLTKADVPLSMGQILGNKGISGRMFNKLESLPLVGDMMAGQRIAANNIVARGALDDAIAPYGGNVTGEGVEALSSAQGLKKQAYSDAFNGINAPIDAQYLADVSGPIRTGRNIPGDVGGDFSYMVSDGLRPNFGANRSLDGTTAQQFMQDIGSYSADLTKRGALGNKAGNNMREIGRATEDLIDRTNPGKVAEMQAANAVNARLTPIENAFITANGNVPTPLQLRRAITSNTKKYGGRASAATGDRVPSIVDDAADILPSTVPNSGTADRGLAAALLPAALGGSAIGAQYMTENPQVSVPLGFLAAISTKGGAKAMQKLLVSRPDAMRKAGGLFGRKRVGQGFGALGVGSIPMLAE